MLPRSHRLTTAEDFRRTVRSGRRAGGPLLVVHLDQHASAEVGGSTHDTSSQVRVGFVVSKAVGVAVVRNRVRRRLRHLVAERMDTIVGPRLVLRALPASASASYADLGAELDRCLARCRPRVGSSP